MNFKEAYKILEIPENSSQDEAKKSFRKLAAKYHPDVNKAPDAEEKFKKVNEAWQVINSGKSTDTASSYYGAPDFIDLNDFIGNISSYIDGNPFETRKQYKKFDSSNIELHQTISFRESVLGCTRDIKYYRNIKCNTCQGRGEKAINNGCGQCGGTGRLKSFANYSVFIQPCPSCNGKISYEPCTSCSTNGTINIEETCSVNIPPRVMEGNILNLGNRGNYMGDMMGMENYSRLLLHMHVVAQDGLSLRNNDVVSQVNITLLEAIEGCKKNVPSIDGIKEITIPKLTKHKDEIITPQLGVKRIGNQITIINVEYPSDINSLTNALKGK